MKRRSKIIATITTMCLALSMLVVGVLAASTVTFDITGTISYIVEDVYVEFEARVYSSSKRYVNADDLQTTALSLESSNFDDINAMANLDGDTFNKVQIKNTSSPSTWSANNTDYYDTYSSLEGGEHSPLGLTLNYSSNPTKILTYFVIVKVKNLSSAPLYAYIPLSGDNKLAMPGNSLLYNTGSYVTIENQNESKYMVFAFSIDDMSKELETTACNFPIKVTIDDSGIGNDVPAISLTHNGYVNTNPLPLATSKESAIMKELILEYNSALQYFTGVDLEIPESQINLYSTEQYIDINFTIGLSVNGQEMTCYQALYYLEYSNQQIEYIMKNGIFVSKKPLAETSSQDDLIIINNGLIVNIAIDGSLYETCTISIPKNQLVDNKFSFGFYGDLAGLVAELETRGGKFGLVDFWSETPLNYLNKTQKQGTYKYEIDNSTILYTEMPTINEEYTDGYFIIINMTFNDIPKTYKSINFNISTTENIYYFISPENLTDASQMLYSIFFESIDMPTGHDSPLPYWQTADLSIPEDGAVWTLVIMFEKTSVLEEKTVRIIPKFGEEVELWKYELSDNGEYYIFGGPTWEGRFQTEYEIPSVYKGLPVKEIKAEAFWDMNAKIVEIIIPESVEKIGGYAFSLCSYLEKIVIKGENVEMGDHVFSDTSAQLYVRALGPTDEKDDSYWLSFMTGSALYYYSETQKDGNYWHYVDGVATKWN